MNASNTYHRGVLVALLYLVFGFSWILITDHLTENGGGLGSLQTYKGLFFVLCSSILIFTLVYWLHQKLHRDQVHSKSLFKHSGLAFLVCNRDGSIHNCNENISVLLGYYPHELKSKKLQDLVAKPEELPAQLRNYHSKSETSDDFEHNNSLIHKDGYLIPVKIKGSVHRDRADHVVLISFVIEDLRESLEQQAALRLQKEFTETALLNLPIGVSIHRTNTNERTFINEKFTEIYGWPEEFMTDIDSFFEHVYPDPDYRATIKTRIMQDVASGDPKRMKWSNVRITTQKGEERYVSAINIPVPDQQLMISTVRDVTEAYLASERLVKSKKTTRAA